MRAHGTRACYVFGPNPGRGKGCRCEPCREANRAYARLRDRQSRHPEVWGSTDLVSAATAREYLQELQEIGIGRRRVAAVTGVSQSVLVRIRHGQIKRVRKETERKILDVTGLDRGAVVIVDAAPTWELLDCLLRVYPKARVAQMLGAKRPALQISRERVTRRTEVKVRVLHEALLLKDARVRAACSHNPDDGQSERNRSVRRAARARKAS